MKFAICNEIFQDWKIEDAAEFSAKAGYDALEIAPFTIAPYVTDILPAARERVRQAAARAGLAISGIHWVLARTEGLHLTHPDPAIRERTSNYLCDLVDFCADLGGHIVVLGSPKQRSVMEGTSSRQAWEWATATVRASVARASDRGLTICLEPLSPSETNFINTAAEAIRFVQQFQSPSFRIILDVKAMSSESKPVAQIIRDSWPHFAYFHANDTNLKGPGFGEIDFKPIAAALKEVGYDGYLSVEVFNFEEGPEVIAARSIDYLKKMFV
jgi:sugar phosphate isomerase/epimerase